MPQFFLNKRLIVLLISVILLVAMIGFSIRERDRISKPEQFVRDIVGLGQSVIAKPANALAGFFDNIEDLKNTYTENKKLKSHLEQLTSLEAQNHELKKENENLRSIIKEKNSLGDSESIQAQVIARNPDNWYEQVVIDKGEVNGVAKNMAVVTSGGFLGKVTQVDKFYSTVELLSSPDETNRVSAKVQNAKKDAYGLIEGYDKKTKMLLLKQLDFNIKVKKGDHVVTSGLSGMFPSGLLIGDIEKVTPDENGLTQTAYVKPAANFYDVREVLVINRKTQKFNAGGTGGGQ
ncbi:MULTISPECIES: rod shape-determining protein MreC [Heyndrickxia]|uniref:Cell shape-determining protein MreC n=1 Tax=Heyndrickxia coagulans DSM 1 = ATCC 7050 TaxID=1121088 RepID=A0A8B4BTB4_HEYCO|nr:rod shape-determining protein MreC [Heyndrickxia coagulans]AJH78986.1 rod shape-determining protein MreC [Heyndrickxia coagulans DSM 1 = ATCC 7050]MCR2846786.1 rod shape-determining protein MreC [Heyndrickxia coagulans]MDR4223953.1 rod shape-determining protein MreC [Heyndrickxia coagulans DSM 1 = ATCC 7050]MEC5267873.1 rod shape-determining protein MreC [Heyndrickxia coagulans]MED4345336.1 rod shape-determining protein MreC [Heyndrickxia coagulans]